MNNKNTLIGQRIKFLREQSGFTQSNIAKYLKVDQSLISKIEAGERSLTVDMLENLAALFGVAVEKFSSELLLSRPIVSALRASDMTERDLETISAIHKIALNLNFMDQLLKEKEDNG